MKTTLDSVGQSMRHTMLYRIMFLFGLIALIGLFMPQWLVWIPLEIKTILIICAILLAITLFALFGWSIGLTLGEKDLVVEDKGKTLLNIKYSDVEKVTMNPLWGTLYFKMKDDKKIIILKGVTRTFSVYKELLRKIH